jgi:hypothetical protein
MKVESADWGASKYLARNIPVSLTPSRLDLTKILTSNQDGFALIPMISQY